jgi:hypothetical protein
LRFFFAGAFTAAFFTAGFAAACSPAAWPLPVTEDELRALLPELVRAVPTTLGAQTRGPATLDDAPITGFRALRVVDGASSAVERSETQRNRCRP